MANLCGNERLDSTVPGFMRSSWCMRTARLPKVIDHNLTQVFDILRTVAAEKCFDTPLRVAGGWVRDAIMQRDSNDVDIAIETPPGFPELLTGAKFATLVAEYIGAHPEYSATVGTMSVIKTNPEKSKHIETAQMKVLGIPLEFCHLRQDDYTNSAGHRVPEVRPGTPLEDALRRDFTCNSLFYNLQTGLVEDYCNGIADLEQRVLRCPLSPYETFFDDPLRILRGVRFLGQLGFSFHQSIVEIFSVAPESPASLPYPYTVDVGALHPLSHALICKVARERAAIELTKMFSGKDPAACVRALLNINVLFPTILVETYYSTKPKGKNVQPDIIVPMVVDSEMQFGLASQITIWLSVLLRVVPTGEEAQHDRVAIVLSALLGPVLKSSPSVSATRPCDDDRIEAAVLRWMKLPTRVCDFTRAIFAAAEHIRPHVEELMDLPRRAAESADSSAMLLFGHARTALFRALRLLQHDPKEVPYQHTVSVCVAVAFLQASSADALNETDVAAHVATVTAIVGAESNGALLHACIAGPLLKGDQLSKYISLPRQETGKAIELQREFMLHHPNCSEVDIVEYLKSLYPSALHP